MARPAGPLESTVREMIADKETYQLSGEASSGTLDLGYNDAAAAREALNTHMGRLQLVRAERDDRLQRAEIREGREHEAETDPLNPRP
jgi:hypothetical protein